MKFKHLKKFINMVKEDRDLVCEIQFDPDGDLSKVILSHREDSEKKCSDCCGSCDCDLDDVESSSDYYFDSEYAYQKGDMLTSTEQLVCAISESLQSDPSSVLSQDFIRSYNLMNNDGCGITVAWVDGNGVAHLAGTFNKEQQLYPHNPVDNMYFDDNNRSGLPHLTFRWSSVQGKFLMHANVPHAVIDVSSSPSEPLFRSRHILVIYSLKK